MSAIYGTKNSNFGGSAERTSLVLFYPQVSFETRHQGFFPSSPGGWPFGDDHLQRRPDFPCCRLRAPLYFTFRTTGSLPARKGILFPPSRPSPSAGFFQAPRSRAICVAGSSPVATAPGATRTEWDDIGRKINPSKRGGYT